MRWARAKFQLGRLLKQNNFSAPMGLMKRELHGAAHAIGREVNGGLAIARAALLDEQRAEPFAFAPAPADRQIPARKA